MDIDICSLLRFVIAKCIAQSAKAKTHMIIAYETLMNVKADDNQSLMLQCLNYHVMLTRRLSY